MAPPRHQHFFEPDARSSRSEKQCQEGYRFKASRCLSQTSVTPSYSEILSGKCRSLSKPRAEHVKTQHRDGDYVSQAARKAFAITPRKELSVTSGHHPVIRPVRAVEAGVSPLLQSIVQRKIAKSGLPLRLLRMQSLPALARDFEMHMVHLPSTWQLEYNFCLKCAGHIQKLVLELVIGTRRMAPITHDVSIPVSVSLAFPNVENWPSEYAPSWDIIDAVLTRWTLSPEQHQQELQHIFLKVACTMDDVLFWTLGDVQRFGNLTFKEYGLSVPQWPTSVWYQWFRDCDDGSRTSLRFQDAIRFAWHVLNSVYSFLDVFHIPLQAHMPAMQDVSLSPTLAPELGLAGFAQRSPVVSKSKARTLSYESLEEAGGLHCEEYAIYTQYGASSVHEEINVAEYLPASRCPERLAQAVAVCFAPRVTSSSSHRDIVTPRRHGSEAAKDLHYQLQSPVKASPRAPHKQASLQPRTAQTSQHQESSLKALPLAHQESASLNAHEIDHSKVDAVDERRAGAVALQHASMEAPSPCVRLPEDGGESLEPHAGGLQLDLDICLGKVRHKVQHIESHMNAYKASASSMASHFEKATTSLNIAKEALGEDAPLGSQPEEVHSRTEWFQVFTPTTRSDVENSFSSSLDRSTKWPWSGGSPSQTLSESIKE